MRRLRLLVLALLGSLMLGGCGIDVYKLPLPGGTDVGDHPMTVHIMFRDVLDLVPQSTVKVNDVNVGKVTDVSLDGYTADVTVQLRRDVELPDNAEATIRQTSLLGEKFVSLAAPESGASANPLRSGDVIPLERSGRNPEVEEVLGALSLLLNGGGVAQLRTIAKELNIALEGREGTTRSVLGQVQTLMTQLDDHKADIVNAIDKLNDLSVAINKQRSSIDAALEELPSALTSIDKQRKDLVKLLQALAELSDVGVGVIKASKDATIDSLQQLSPVLSQIAASGDDFVNAFNVFLTYPFVDEVVGRDPQVARNLHMGDYTNLSITLDINVDTGITLPTGLPTGLPTLPTDLPTTLPTLVDPTVIIGDVLACLQSGSLTSPECMKVLALPEKLLKLREECAKQENEDKAVCKQLALIPGLPTNDTPSVPITLPTSILTQITSLIPDPAAAGGSGRPPRVRAARADHGAADAGLRPGPGQPARARDGPRPGGRPMITQRTRVQLVVFALITLIGVSFVGARYARLDRLFVDTSYTVVAHFADSGGIFAGGEVSYRGVRVGQVEKLKLTDAGVDVYLDIDNGYDDIPADALAVVGNRSAVGEQYVELQPRSDGKPFLRDKSEIALDDTRTPIPTQKLLGDISTTVESVDQDALRTTVGELGDAFGGTGQDLQRIIDSGTSFIDAANANFDTTTALIRDGNTVLKGQVASASAIRTFAKQLKLFTGSLAGSDKALRAVIDNGSATANELRTFLDENKVDLSELINELVTTGEVVVRHLDGVEQILVIYPYIVEGGFTVVSRSADTGLYDAHFGMILTSNPEVCHARVRVDRPPAAPGGRQPADERERALRRAAHAVQRPRRPERPAGARGVPGAGRWRRTTRLSGHLRWGDRVPRDLSSPGSLAPRTLGGDSWKWLFLQPLMHTN